MGNSIDNRPASVQKQKQFGHLEIDIVIGKKLREDDVLLTLIERKTCDTISQKIAGKDPDSVGCTIKQLIHQFGPLFGRVFRTITADAGSEFSSLTDSLKEQATHVYYTHPYAA